MTVETMLVIALGTIALFLLALIVALVMVVRRQTRRADFLKRIAKPYGAAVGNDVGFDHDGRHFVIQLYGKSKRFPVELFLKTDCPVNGSLILTREGTFEKLFKRIRVSTEVQTGDPAFDAAIYISTTDESFAAAYLKNPDMRKCGLRLMEMGFSEIRMDGNHLKLRLHTAGVSAEPLLLLVKNAAACMSVLLSDVPQHVQKSAQPAGLSDAFKQWAVIGGAGLVLIIGIVAYVWADAFCWPLSPLTVFMDSIQYSLPALIIFTVLSVIWLKGRSSSHLEIIAAVGIALAGFPLAGFGIELIINGEWDEAPIRSHEVRVIRKYSNTYKSSTTYYVEVESWRSATDMESVAFPRNAWEGIEPGHTELVCDTKPGRLGFEWLLGCNIR